MHDSYSFARLFVDIAEAPDAIIDRLASTGDYRRDGLGLARDDVSISVHVNTNRITPDEPAFLAWPVTMEVFQDDDEPVSDETMLAVVRHLKAQFESHGAAVVVAADFEDEV